MILLLLLFEYLLLYYDDVFDLLLLGDFMFICCVFNIGLFVMLGFIVFVGCVVIGSSDVLCGVFVCIIVIDMYVYVFECGLLLVGVCCYVFIYDVLLLVYFV